MNEFVEIYAFYIEAIGIDGLRIDTVKHVDREFWDAFTSRLRARVGPERAKRLLLFGEVYDGNAAKQNVKFSTESRHGSRRVGKSVR